MEKNKDVSLLLRKILANSLLNISSYQAWRLYFGRYIDISVINRKQNLKQLESQYQADFFQIIFSTHLIVYLLAKEFLTDLKIPKSIKADLDNDLFEATFKSFSAKSQELINLKIRNLFRNFDITGYNHTYDILENLYRSIVPAQVRKPLGEYFTPLSLARNMTNDVEKKYSGGYWVDDSSGFGAFLFAFLEKYGINCLDKFICVEVNPLSVFITKVILLSEYKDDIKKIKKIPVYWGDVLLNETYKFIESKIVVIGSFSKYYNKFQVVIGNPPWVSWKSMTKDYQNLIGDDWRSYGIFEKNITRNTLGACNDDLSSYFVYFSIDRLLNKNGILKFVINLSLFKSNLAGKNFRQFNIVKSQTPFKISKIYDFSNHRIFSGVSNSYCVFDAIKGKKTLYPIPYFMVYGEDEKKEYKIVTTTARPVNNLINGSLITENGNREQFDAIEGLCEYRARAGVCTWLNSVYWVREISKDGLFVSIENLGTSGKKKVKELEARVEKDLFYRLLRARNLKDFNPKIDNYILIPQKKGDFSKPIPEEEMKVKYKNAYAFFLNFKKELENRSGYKKFLSNQPFYGLYNIGPYTTASIKLGWQFVSKKFQVFIIDNAEDIIPDLNVMFIPLNDIEEAYYLHALLNSKYASQKIESSSNWTFPSGSIQKIYIEKFNPKDKLHKGISDTQKNILKGDKTNLEIKMDEYFKEYWFKNRKKKLKVKQTHLSFT